LFSSDENIYVPINVISNEFTLLGYLKRCRIWLSLSYQAAYRMGRKHKIDSSSASDKNSLIYGMFPGRSSVDQIEQDNSNAPDFEPLSEDLISCEIRYLDPEKSKCHPQSAILTPTRSFRDNWKQNRPWLEYDPAQKLMFCSDCKHAQLKNTFTEGCRVLKSESLTKHESGKGEDGSRYFDIITK